DDGHPSAHAAFDAASPICSATVVVSLPGDFVMNLESCTASGFKPHTDFDALHGLSAHDGMSDETIELAVPMHETAESSRDSRYDDFVHPTKRCTLFASLFNYFDHLVG